MARYSVGSVVGNMRIIKQYIGKLTTKGMIPYYDVECQHCGRARNMSHDALRKRKNTGAIKCASCSQEKEKGRYAKNKKQNLGYELNVPKELFDKFISLKW